MVPWYGMVVVPYLQKCMHFLHKNSFLMLELEKKIEKKIVPYGPPYIQKKGLIPKMKKKILPSLSF